MPNLLLERYRNGQTREVWQDMVALGTAARSDFYYKEVKEVASETMLRARRNIESIIPKLDQLGYRFSSSDDAPDALAGQDPWTLMQATMQKLAPYAQPGYEPRDAHEAAMAQIAKNVATMKASMQGSMQERATQIAGQLDKNRAAAEAFRKKYENKPSGENPRIFDPAGKKAAGDVDKLEKKMRGPLPISLRCWYEQVGGVSLGGTHELLNPKDRPADPLAISPFSDSLEYMKAMRDEDDADDEGFEWMLWGEEGDVTAIKIPDPAADGSVLGLHNQPAFVEFLREAFAWGGFPGWQRTSQRPQKELDYLREGLLPL